MEKTYWQKKPFWQTKDNVAESTARVKFDRRFELSLLACSYHSYTSYLMNNNIITAEEQDTDKHCPERKAFRRKWLATLCLSSGRHECALRGNPMLLESTNGWDDLVTTTQVQVTVS